jgi:hypothetical protein
LLAHWQTSQAKLKPKLAKELTKPALSIAFMGGFEISRPTKNKINSCSVSRSVQIDKKTVKFVKTCNGLTLKNKHQHTIE